MKSQIVAAAIVCGLSVLVPTATFAATQTAHPESSAAISQTAKATNEMDVPVNATVKFHIEGQPTKTLKFANVLYNYQWSAAGFPGYASAMDETRENGVFLMLSADSKTIESGSVEVNGDKFKGFTLVDGSFDPRVDDHGYFSSGYLINEYGVKGTYDIAVRPIKQ